MNINESKSWSVWIDETNKIVSTKEIPQGKKVHFKNKDTGIEIVMKLVSKGYKIG